MVQAAKWQEIHISSAGGLSARAGSNAGIGVNELSGKNGMTIITAG